MRKTVYKLVLFDMDETLLKGRTIHIIGRKKGFVDEVLRLEASDIISYKKNKMIAMLLKGLSERELLEMFQGIELQEYVPEVMDALRKKGVKTAIVTNCYQFLADALRQRLGMDYAVGNDLVMNNGVVTGELRIQNTFLEQVFEGCKIHPICKRSLVDWFSKKLKIAPE